MHGKSVFKIDFESMKNKFIDNKNVESYSARTLHMTLKSIFEIFDSSTMFSSTAKKMSLGSDVKFKKKLNIYSKNSLFQTFFVEKDPKKKISFLHASNLVLVVRATMSVCSQLASLVLKLVKSFFLSVT